MDSTDCAVFLLPHRCFRCHKTASFLSKVFCILPKVFCILRVSATLEVTREEREQYRRTVHSTQPRQPYRGRDFLRIS